MAATHDNAGIAAWRFKLEGEIGSYEDCATFLAEYGGPVLTTSRKLGPQMTVVRNQDEGYCAVRLYATEIIRYYPDGTFSVDNGGFNTLTTKARLDARMQVVSTSAGCLAPAPCGTALAAQMSPAVKFGQLKACGSG